MDESDLYLKILSDDRMFTVLEYMYVNGKVNGDEIRKECDSNILNLFHHQKVINRSFWKRGTYIKSTYWISKKGRDIYELIIAFKKDRK